MCALDAIEACISDDQLHLQHTGRKPMALFAPLLAGGVWLSAQWGMTNADKVIHRVYHGANCTTLRFSQEFRTGYCHHHNWYRWGDPWGDQFLQSPNDPRYEYMQLRCEEQSGEEGVLLKYWSYDFWKQGCARRSIDLHSFEPAQSTTYIGCAQSELIKSLIRKTQSP